MRLIIPILALLALLYLPACRADLSDLQVASVAEVAAWSDAGEAFTFCDANNADTRERYGVVPGALLLSNYRDYEVEAELPLDRDATLVFYCHSETCGAAGDAARKAVASGYRDVWVMAPGITGWADAGQPIAQVGTQESSS
jgi:rhodanese-related sulfurtransferase